MSSKGIVDILEKSFLNYSMSVICSRALPNIIDGLKPVHRRILWGMKKLKLSPSGNFVKSAKIVGEVMGNYHPHGDQSIYFAMVRMAQVWSMNQPHVIGHGNFGSLDGDDPAAMRYTEVKLSRISSFLLQDTDPLYVDFVDNFDGTRQEPTLLGAMFPNLIVNGSDGIAVGMATKMFPHNLHEVILAAIWHIDNIDIIRAIPDEKERIEQAVRGYTRFMLGPDFPTGGLIYGLSGIKEGLLTGRGAFNVRAKIEIKTGSKGKQTLIIHEIPYGVNKSKLLITIKDLMKDGELDEIPDWPIDISSDNEVRIEIGLRKGSDAEVIKNKLFKKTDLDQSYNYLNLVLIDGRPEIVSLYSLFDHWMDHRIEVVSKRLGHELSEKLLDLEIKEGYIKAAGLIDDIIAAVKKASTPFESQKSIMGLGFTADQAKAINEMKIRKIASFEQAKLTDELDALRIRIKEIENILSDEKKVLDIIKLELHEVKARIKSPRKSTITSDDLGIRGMADLVKKDNVVVTLTRDNYIRRVSLGDYTVQHRARKGKIGAPTKEEDIIIDSFIMTSHDLMLLFTNTGRVYKMKAWDVPSTDRKSRGTPIVNILPLEEDERIFKILPIKEFDDQREVVFATIYGKVKTTNLSLFKNVKSDGIYAIVINESDKLLDVYLSHEFGEDPTKEKFILMTSTENKAVRFSIDDAMTMGRVASGVKGIKLRDGHTCRSMTVVSNDDEVLVLTTDGWGKRTDANGFPLNNRNTTGTSCMNKNTERGGNLFGAFRVREEDEVLLISKNGKVIRIMAKEIKRMARIRLGVRLMVMKDDHLVSTTIRNMG